MSTSAEDTVREFFRLLAARETRAAVDLLADDVIWKNTGLPTFTGRRVGAMLLDADKRGVTVEIEVHHAATSADGTTVLTDRTDVIGLGRWKSAFGVRGTLRVVDGKIVLWDDAFSWGDVVKGNVLGLLRMF